MSDRKLIGEEAKHIVYVKDQHGSNHDLLMAKVIRHYDNGDKEPALNFHEDWKRSFYVTKPGIRKHEQKKDYEYLKNLNQYSCTQINLSRAAVKVLEDYQHGPDPYIKRLARNPYLYGVDVTSATLLKNEYRQKNPDLLSANTVSAGDIETSVFHEDEHIILLSVTCKNKVFLGVLEDWISTVDNPIPKIREITKQKMLDGEGKSLLDVRNITEENFEILVLPTPGRIVVEAMRRLHQWKPDFFTFWNMTFDIKRMKIALERENIDPAIIFCDPSIPNNYKKFKFIEPSEQKVTSSGKVSSKNIEDLWPWAEHLASFQIVDSMPIYRELRRAAGKDPSYKLDYILEKELKMNKLRFPETDKYNPGTLRWHQVMQKDYKVEYCVYNIFDSISLELLDEKTNDLSNSISSFSKNSEYRIFNSNPKRLCDDMHFWYLNREEPCVIASSSDQMEQPIDKFVIGHKNIIVTLPSYMSAPNGIDCILEY